MSSNQQVESRFKLPLAVYVVLQKGEEILLLKRRNTGYADGLFSLVAGHVDGGEEIKDAAVREAREEVGIMLAADCIDIIGVMHRQSLAGSGHREIIDVFVRCSDWTGEVRNEEEHKCSAVEWFQVGELPQNILPHVEHALRLSKQNQGRMWFSSYGWNKK